jgi:death on curing protein
LENEPFFLTREQIDAIHREQVDTWGGMPGLRNENGLESAIAQPQNVYLYGNGDLYEIAAAYAFHIAESQAYVDGNKRTGVQAALDLLEINGIDTSPLPEAAAYNAMIKVAMHKLDRAGLAELFRQVLAA